MQQKTLYSITSSARARSAGGREAEYPGGFRVDDQLELARLQDGQIRRLSAFEYAAEVDPLLTKPVHDAGS